MATAQKIDVEGWVQDHLGGCIYTGDDTFLAPATQRTKDTWTRCLELLKEEAQKGGTLDIDVKTPSTITSHKPGFVLEGKDVIKGLQTDYPLKRACKPNGGARMVEAACKSYGYTVDPEMMKIFTEYRKTHNAGVFDAYDDSMRALRSAHLLTGLPDAYARGRIIGDYRRVALYGVDALIAAKQADKKALGPVMTEEVIRSREEVSEQIASLNELKQMATSYGVDISKPATSAHEAIQSTYIAYLAAIKEQDGAAMSFGRVDTFFDIYIEKDIKAGKITESQAQEMIDDFVVKLRLVRHLRTPAFEELFSGNPTWVTATIGGVDGQNRPLVTKTSFRILHTLINLGPSPEPNLTVLWSTKMPEGFKRFCTKISILTSSIQYENDDIMRPQFGSDYSISCCVSAMALGKQMQFFGARCNLPKLLLYVMNNGRDEISGKQIGPKSVFPDFPEGQLDLKVVKERFGKAMEWLAGVYANTMNCIHFMHDKYYYERLEMALHDSDPHRFMAYGVAGISVLADSLSAIEHAKVTPIRDERGLATDFKIEGSFPKYGNDDDRVDKYAKWATHEFITELRKHKCYRGAEPTLSVLTITSNVVYGKATGATPDGRKALEPFAPGANPMHCRDSSGAFASLNSVAKIDYDDCKDGISNTFSLVPSTLGKEDGQRVQNLVAMIDGYFTQKAHHLNVNVLNREVLRDAVDHPEKYPQLTIRVSGYAVSFTRLTKDQQMEVISRTFHESM